MNDNVRPTVGNGTCNLPSTALCFIYRNKTPTESEFEIMRKLGLQSSLTAQLYQSGRSWPEAEKMGANRLAWETLQDRYGGSLIPNEHWLGSHHLESPKLAHTASGYSY